MKNLYSIRSTIVHSKSEYDKPSKEYFQDPTKKIEELEEIVREVLQKLIWIHDFDLNMPKDKKELWNYLNAKGFPG